METVTKNKAAAKAVNKNSSYLKYEEEQTSQCRQEDTHGGHLQPFTSQDCQLCGNTS
jgi:hypothetical protein